MNNSNEANIERTRQNIQKTIEMLEISSKKRQLLESDLSKLNENVMLMKNKLATNKQLLKFYKCSYEKILQQSENYTLQKNKATIALAINKNIIEEYKVQQMDHKDIVIKDQTQQHFSIKKQELLAQKEKLLLLIKEKISYLRSNTRAKIS